MEYRRLGNSGLKVSEVGLGGNIDCLLLPHVLPLRQCDGGALEFRARDGSKPSLPHLSTDWGLHASAAPRPSPTVQPRHAHCSLPGEQGCHVREAGSD